MTINWLTGNLVEPDERDRTSCTTKSAVNARWTGITKCTSAETTNVESIMVCTLDMVEPLQAGERDPKAPTSHPLIPS